MTPKKSLPQKTSQTTSTRTVVSTISKAENGTRLWQVVLTGITRNKQAEAELIASEQKYHSRIMTKLDLDSLPALVKFATQHGLTGLG